MGVGALPVVPEASLQRQTPYVEPVPRGVLPPLSLGPHPPGLGLPRMARGALAASLAPRGRPAPACPLRQGGALRWSTVPTAVLLCKRAGSFPACRPQPHQPSY